MFILEKLGYKRSLANPTYLIWHGTGGDIYFNIATQKVELNTYFTQEEIQGMLEYGASRKDWLKNPIDASIYRSGFATPVLIDGKIILGSRCGQATINPKSKIVLLQGSFPLKMLMALNSYFDEWVK